MNAQITISIQTRMRNGMPAISVSIPDLDGIEQIDLDFDALDARLNRPAPVALDFLLIASAVYVLDKCIERRRFDDFWTRDLHVTVPVSDPRKWQGVHTELAETLDFLTGDEWSFDFAQMEDIDLAVNDRRNPVPSTDRVSAVSLFSGGVDSLIGVVNHLSQTPGDVVLVGHRDASSTGGDQRRLFEAISAEKLFEGRVIRRGARIRPLPLSQALPGQEVRPLRREHTLRSRSLVFIAMGVYAAQQAGANTPLLIPENGFIALNIPLTPSRIGTCSTRTTHPFFLERIRSVLDKVGLNQTVVNPLVNLTKGEAIAHAEGGEEVQNLLLQTVSCAHPSRRAPWIRRSSRNCGYCVPCLVRRASFHYVGVDNGEDYGLDALRGELPIDGTIASDLRAVLDCLAQVRHRSEVQERVMSTGSLVVPELEMFTDLIGRGLGEIRSLVRDKASAAIRSNAGMR